MTLEEWIETAAGELGVEALTAPERQLLLDVARDVAHNTHRPAAPLSAYLIGLAVGRGASLSDAVDAVGAAARRAGGDGD